MSGVSENLQPTSSIDATAAAAVPPVISYHDRLNQDRGWAMDEGSLFFEGKGKVQEALRRITKRLNELDIPYAVVGGMALFKHGYRRFTEDVDLLVTRDSLNKIHEALDGLGYVRPFAGSKNLRDTDAGVKVEFLISGDYPGDGKPKPVVFPDPTAATVLVDGMKVLQLKTIVELKIASGISNAHRLKDLVDVQELAKHVRFASSFKDELNPYVRDKFIELCEGIPSAEEEAEGP